MSSKRQAAASRACASTRRATLSSGKSSGPRSLGTGAWPDGIAFDSCGNLWGTLVYSDKLFVLTAKGDLRILLDEGDPAKVVALERAFFQQSCDRRRAVRDRPGRGALDGERHVRRSRSADCVHRLAAGKPHSVFPCARPGAADGALEESQSSGSRLRSMSSPAIPTDTPSRSFGNVRRR